MGNTGQSITLANSIIGVGILAMPFCFQQCGVLLATLILMLMGLVSRLCCHFLLKSAIITRRRNFEFLAFHVFGPAGKMAVEVGIIGFLMGTCIAYFVVVGDLGPQIVAKLFNINQSDILRTSIMVIVSLVCVLPLGLLRNVDSLSNVSAATIGFYFCLVIKVITEATSQLLTSDWHTRIEMWKPSGILQCVPIISMALFCQTQLFEIFESMPSLSLEKMNKVTKTAINICTAVYFTLGIFGYVAFSSHEISGNILMSLSPTMASDVIKLGFVMSVAFSFPLIIFPCRASLYSFLYRKPHSSHHDHIINHSIPEGTFRGITVCIVAVALCVSLLIPNIELVLGLVGSTIGVLVCVVFPAACFVNVTLKNTNERVLAKVVILLGLIILVLGTYANLQAAENTRDKYDEKQITQERIDKIVQDFFEKRDKSDGVVVETPQLIVDSLPKVEVNKINGDLKKDSEVQPPNPIPPDSHSEEKNPVVKVPELIDDTKLKQVLAEVEVAKDPVDKVSESNPKILPNKVNDAEVLNGGETVEKLQEKPKDAVKQHSSQEKSDIQKHQKLIETIKQYGKEQKELIKEQKEILGEIQKTKIELQKDKEVGSIEAKKIAVESIQKIANMAIQSLSGVTDKPVDNVDKVKEPIQKIADEAVQEIAKKAADAIKEIKDTKLIKEKAEIKVDNKNEILDNTLNNNEAKLKPVPAINDLSVIQSNSNKDMPNNNIIDNANVQANVPNPNQQANILSNLNSQNIIQPSINIPSESKVIKQQKDAIPLKEHSHSPDEPQSYKRGEDEHRNINLDINKESAQIVQLPKIINHDITSLNNGKLQNVPLQENINTDIKPPNNEILQNVPLKENIHPDAGEIKHLNNGNPQNIPLPIALRDNLKNQDTSQSAQNIKKPETQHKNQNNLNNVALDKENNNLNEIKNGAVEDNQINSNIEFKNVKSDSLVVRQKREIDCKEENPINLEDKQICENLKNRPILTKQTEEILNPNMNLNDIALPKDLSVQQMAIHHIRSLKSFSNDKKR